MVDTQAQGGDNRPRHEILREDAVRGSASARNLSAGGDTRSAVIAQNATTAAMVYVGDQLGRIADALEQGFDFYRKSPPGS